MSDTYCPLPFKQIVMKQFSDTKCVEYLPCTNMYKTDILDVCSVRPKTTNCSNVNSLLEAFDSYKSIRDDMNNGIRPKQCSVCWKLEDKNKKSYRKNISKFLQDTDKYIVDINCGNICNFACRMCTPGLSTRLTTDYTFFEKNGYLDRVKLSTDNFFINDMKSNPVKSNEWLWIRENLDIIKGIKFAGGEPFYNKNVLELLDYIIHIGKSKNINLSFHSNGVSITKRVIDIFEHFNGIYANISIDATDDLFHYIRYPGDFYEFEKCVDKLKNCKTLKELQFNCVVSSLNLFDLNHIIDWVGNKYYLSFVSVFPENRGINIKNLSCELLNIAYNSYKNEVLKNMFLTAINENTENKYLLKEEIILFDVSRNQNFENFLNPLLVKWIK